MILNCPNCIAEFYLKDDALGDTGRKVKCSACGVTWMQRPEGYEEPENGDGGVGSDSTELPDQSADDDDGIEEALENIIESLEDEVEQGLSEEREENELSSLSGVGASGDDIENYRPSGFTAALGVEQERGNKRRGYLAAACVFCLSFVLVLLSGSSLISAYPSAQAFYGLFGIRADIPGKGLGFDSLNVVTDGSVVKIKGRVVNYSDAEVHVPKIIAFIKDSHDEVVAEHLITPARDILPEQGVFSFDDVVEGLHLSLKDQYSLTVRFTMDYEAESFKIGAEAGGSNQAHHQGESDHQSVHVRSEGSRPHVSSDAHPEPSHQSQHSSH